MTVAANLVSCSTDEQNMNTRQGYIDLTVSLDARFRLPDGQTYTPPENSVPVADSMSVTLESADGRSHTWPTVRAFRADAESYMEGAYTITLSGEKQGGPRMTGSADLQIVAGEHTRVSITATPDVALLRTRRSDGSDRFTLDYLTVHAPLQGYVDITAPDTALYMNYGTLMTYAHIHDNSDRRAVLTALPVNVTLERATVSDMSVQLRNDAVSILVNDRTEGNVSLADGLPAESPVATPSGFTPGVAVNILEGLTLKDPVVMTVTSAAAPLKHVNIVVDSPIIRESDLDYNTMDLLNLSTADREYLTNAGFSYSISEDRRTVVADFTHLLEEMASHMTTESRFILLAEDMNSACNEPLQLLVSTRVMELEPVSTSGAVVGVNRASVTIKAGSDVTEQGDFSVYTTDADGNYTVPLPVTSMSHDADSSITLNFTVPSGTGDVPVSVRYLGLERFTAVIKRVNPQFRLNVDPFATTAIVRVAFLDPNIQNPEDVRAEIIRLGSVTVNGAPASVWQRSPEQGALIITGLTPSADYRVDLTLVPGAPAASQDIHTENTAQVPSGDFGDWHHSFKYDHLACGGKFSATSVPVVNRQNFIDIHTKWPKKHWTSMNAKTFNTAARNHNTWYMQPCALLEDRDADSYVKTIAISSVGYDLDGEDIADYIQKDGESLPYSAVVPHVKSRAAGRLWLGSYSFDAATGREEITEGVPFNCRPSALNGFFRYLPDLTDGSDYGMVRLELVNIADGRETVIATGTFNFRTRPDYTAFKCPIDYTIYNLKPTHLRIMFLSSHHAGGTGRDADAQVPVTADLPNARMRGSTLWVSQLSFSY